MGELIKEYYSSAESRLSKADAQTIGPELDKLFERGSLMAADVVEAAKPPLSPLHRYFEWDDKKAGHLYRVSQAKQIIRSIEIRVITKAGPKSLAAYQSIDKRAQPEERFAAVRVIQKKREQACAIAQKAKRELDQWRLQYGGYVALFPELEESFAAICHGVDDVCIAFESERVSKKIENASTAALEKSLVS